MSMKNFTKIVVLAVVSVGICTDFAWADKSRQGPLTGQQLQEKLSKDISIKLDDVTIAEALEKIGQKAGLKIVLSDEAIWKLPQGKATRLSVILDGPLAESLTEMLNAFFMRYAVGEEEITIYPRPELEHILGRPTTKQLELLKAIYTNSIKYIESPQNTINTALDASVSIVPYYVMDNIDEMLHRLAGKELEHPRPEGLTFCLPGLVTVANILEQTEDPRFRDYKTEWYLSGPDFPNQIPEIRVVIIRDFRQAKLNQIVDISFKDESDFVVLQRLANWAGMELLVYKSDPSWLEGKISVDMQNITLKQALINITTLLDGGIDIDIDDNFLRVEGPYHSKPKASQPNKSQKSSKEADEGYVGKISIPMDGGKYFIEFMLRESDLTEELKKLRADKMKEILERFGRSGTDD